MISVIVPACNAEKYLAQCLASILAQTCRDLDVIVVDDGSADSSGLIACDFARRDRRVRLLRQPNGGVSSARNAGLDMARGEWVAFVDADDWIEPGMYEAMLERVADYDVVMCNYWGADLEGRPRPFDLERSAWTVSGANCLANLARANMLFAAVWNKLYRRAQLERLALRFDERVHLGEDLDFNARLFARADRAIYAPAPLYHYCDHPGSASSRFKPSDLTAFAAWRNLERLLPDDGGALGDCRDSVAQMVFKQACRNALDPASQTRLLPLRPENFAALEREAGRVPGFLGRLTDKQRDIYLKLRGLYEKAGQPSAGRELEKTH